MKKIIIFITAILSYSCTEIPVDQRFEEGIVEVNYTNKNVLLMEMTAIYCPNCPPASKEADRIIKLHQGKVIGMNVHASQLALPKDLSKDPILFSSETFAIWEKAGMPELPSGLINYFATGSELTNTPISWANDVIDELEKPAPMNINLISNMNDVDSSFTLGVEIEYLENQNSNHRLGIYIIEDGIIGTQQDDTRIIEDYEHNYVTRAPVVDIAGVDMFEDLSSGDVWVSNFDIELDEDWVKENLKIVAFIFDTQGNDYIIQAQEIKLIEEIDSEE